MEQQLDRKLVQAFARKLFGLNTDGMLTLMVDIGHRTGLFDSLRAGGTSADIAGRAGINERYVQEWLAAMATGGVVDYDAESQTFTLPAEHAVCLTGTSSRNLAPESQMLAMLAGHVRRVADCFRTGGGVPYSEFRPEFTEAADASWRLLYDGLLLKGFLPVVEGLTKRLDDGIRVADIGCGTGHAINVMAAAFPRSTFVGYDFDEGASAGPETKPPVWVSPTPRSTWSTSPLCRPSRSST